MPFNMYQSSSKDAGCSDIEDDTMEVEMEQQQQQQHQPTEHTHSKEQHQQHSKHTSQPQHQQADSAGYQRREKQLQKQEQLYHRHETLSHSQLHNQLQQDRQQLQQEQQQHQQQEHQEPHLTHQQPHPEPRSNLEPQPTQQDAFQQPHQQQQQQEGGSRATYTQEQTGGYFAALLASSSSSCRSDPTGCTSTDKQGNIGGCCSMAASGFHSLEHRHRSHDFQPREHHTHCHTSVSSGASVHPHWNEPRSHHHHPYHQGISASQQEAGFPDEPSIPFLGCRQREDGEEDGMDRRVLRRHSSASPSGDSGIGNSRLAAQATYLSIQEAPEASFHGEAFSSIAHAAGLAMAASGSCSLMMESGRALHHNTNGVHSIQPFPQPAALLCDVMAEAVASGSTVAAAQSGIHPTDTEDSEMAGVPQGLGLECGRNAGGLFHYMKSQEPAEDLDQSRELSCDKVDGDAEAPAGALAREEAWVGNGEGEGREDEHAAAEAEEWVLVGAAQQQDAAADAAVFWQLGRAAAAAAAAAAALRLQRHRAESQRREGPGSGQVGGGPGSGGSLASLEADAERGWDERAVEELSEEGEEEELDTNAEQLAHGKDLQGIPWANLPFGREFYRNQRLTTYRNYTNLLPEDNTQYMPELLKNSTPCASGARLFDFVRNSRSVATNIVHFQLRNLVWATSRNDVYLVFDNCVNHWDPVSRFVTPVLNLAGGADGTHVPGFGRVQVSTTCVAEGIIAAGGFTGELVCKRIGSPGLMYSGRITHNENGITNAIEIIDTLPHGICVMASNNDSMLRIFAADTFKPLLSVAFDWAVNYATMRPHASMAAVVGDHPETFLTDTNNGVTIAKLAGHQDFSFAAAWHPNGNLLATGNQDTTALVWDIRSTAAPLAMLPGRFAAIRSLRFSPDGAFLAMCDPADFVHVYDVASGFSSYQEVDFFGEISGISFSPDSNALFVGVADQTYASLMHFERSRDPLELLSSEWGSGPTQADSEGLDESESATQ